MAATLPIFRLTKRPHGREDITGFARDRFGLEVFSEDENEIEFSDPEGRRVLRVRRADGALSYRNETLLWRDDAPALEPDLELATFDFSGFLSGWDPAPESTEIMPLRMESLDSGCSTIVRFESPERDARLAASTTREIDRVWSMRVSVLVDDPRTGEQLAVPLIGQTGGFRAGVAAQNTLTSFWGCWWPAEAIDSSPEVEWPPQHYPGEPSREGTTIETLPPRLVYVEAVERCGKTLLRPMWVCEAIEHHGDRSREMTPLLFAATKGAKQAGRTQPLRAPTDDSGDIGLSHRFGIVAQTVSAGTPHSNAVLDNIAALKRELELRSWNFAFEWIDRNAWREDWFEHDDLWVDSVDLLYYQGDASANGWKLYPKSLPQDPQPRTRWLDESDVSTHSKPDVLGDNRLRWLVIDACGPLHHRDTRNPTDSVYYRWKPLFDGIRLLLGMASTVTARPGLAETFVTLMTGPKALPIVDAWLEANLRHRGTGTGLVRAGALFAINKGGNTRYDRFADFHTRVPTSFRTTYLTLVVTSIR